MSFGKGAYQSYETSKIGPPVLIAAAVPVIPVLPATQIIRLVGQAVGQVLVPMSFVILADVDCFVKQGSSATGAAMDGGDVSNTQFLLKTGVYWRVDVESVNDNFLSVAAVGALAGTLRVNRIDKVK